MMNTIFDDVFRTIIEKMPYLVVPLINEIFGTDYPDDVEIIQLRNEYNEKNGEIITDTSLQIENVIYHIECQSSDDRTMAVRMIEYDFSIALDRAVHNGRDYIMEFPKSCVLYIRSFSSLPSELNVRVLFPDGTEHMYRVPVVQVENYTKDIIFQKKLLMLLPYYIMRYERYAVQLEQQPEMLKSLLQEYSEIQKRLQEELLEEHSGLYSDLIELITKISDHIFRNTESVKKGLGDVMGGKVLELVSERLLAEGEEKGIEKGIEKGMVQGEDRLSFLINRLIAEGRNDEISRVCSDKLYRDKLYKEYNL